MSTPDYYYPITSLPEELDDLALIKESGLDVPCTAADVRHWFFVSCRDDLVNQAGGSSEAVAAALRQCMRAYDYVGGSYEAVSITPETVHDQHHELDRDDCELVAQMAAMNFNCGDFVTDLVADQIDAEVRTMREWKSDRGPSQPAPPRR
jgi:hypothetical protein